MDETIGQALKYRCGNYETNPCILFLWKL